MAQEIPGSHLLAEIGQKVLLGRGEEILICRGLGDNTWDLPGGRLHKNEDPREGLLREVREELGIEVVVEGPVDVAAWYGARSGIPRFFVVYGASMKNESDAIVFPPDELEEVRWISEADIDMLPVSPEWKPILRSRLAHLRGKV